MLKSILILILAMLTIQYAASQAKGLFPMVGVAGTSTLRLVFASLMMALVIRPWRFKFSFDQLKKLFLYGTSLGLMNFSFYFALQRIPLGIAVALEFVGPLSVAIFYSRKKIDFVWVLLAASGIFILTPEVNTVHALDPWGMALALLAGLFWALYIVFGKKAGEDFRGEVAATFGMIIAALIVLPFGLWIDGDKLFNPAALGVGLLIAFLGSALPYSLEMIALKKIPARTFGILMSMEPALAALVGLVFLAEMLTVVQWLAILCVILSSLGSSLTSGDPH